MKVSRRWTSFFVVGSLAALVFTGLTGCSEDVVVDPYQYTSLNALMKGTVKDTTKTKFKNAAGEEVEHSLFAFEIDAPKFDYVSGDIGIVRDGNQLHFMVARDLERLAPRLSGALLGVKQAFSPQPTHLVLERIKRGGVIEADSLAAPTGYILPRLLRSGAVDISEPGKDMTDASWKDRKTLMVLMPENEGDELLRFQTGFDQLVYVPRHDLTDEARLNPTAKDLAFYVVLPMGSWELVNLAPGADFMLQMLIAEDLPIVGSVSPASWDEDYATRKIDHGVVGHVVGTLRLNWFKYANAFVEGHRPQ